MTGTHVVDCPKGHRSTEEDYCSECGGKLAGRAGDGDRTHVADGPESHTLCPDCGTVREQEGIPFCEVCGFNFVTGAHGEIGITVLEPRVDQAALSPSAIVTETSIQKACASKWQVLISVDPGLRSAESPVIPPEAEDFVFRLDGPLSLIGRRDEARGIFPEIDLFLDEAVSRRHALVKLDDSQQVSVRDIGAANGTRLNGAELEPMVDYPLVDGDEVTLGHWSKLRLQRMG